jgi:hypothetical protein
MNDAIVRLVIDDSDDENSNVSEDAGRFDPQNVLLAAQPPLLSKGPLKEKWRFNKNDFNRPPPFIAVGPTLSGVPALTGELLGHYCPNWWHGTCTD